MKTIIVPIGDLVPHEKNARKHPENQIRALANAIMEWGWTIPILVDEENTVLAGHGRLEAAKLLGLSNVPVLVAEGWSDAKKRAYVITDNQLSDSSTWNSSLLIEELSAIAESGFDLAITGFDDYHLNLHGFYDGVQTFPTLADDFDIPKTTVMSARGGWWTVRKKEWLSIGIDSEFGREEGILFGSNVQSTALLHKKNKYEALTGESISMEDFLELSPEEHKGKTISIFDPVLCEGMYRWFCPEGGVILDPFSGGSVRGIVAAVLGYDYVGLDIRPEQISENISQGLDVLREDMKFPQWLVGDSKNIKDIAYGVEADMVFSCPPYAYLEVYSDNVDDLSTMNYEEFKTVYTQIIDSSCQMLKAGGFAVFVVGEVRDTVGNYLGFVPDTISAFTSAGLALVSSGVLVTAINSLPTRAGKPFAGSRKVGKTHQNILVFKKA